MKMIDLTELTGNGKVHNLSGRLRGQAAREMFGLDEIDASHEPVRVVIPAYVYSLTPSFFQGLFGASVRKMGNNRAMFKSRFSFDAPRIVLAQLERGLSAVLTNRDINSIR